MRTDSIVKETYEKHSLYLTEIDGKPRFYYFEIENLEEDYAEARKILFKYENVSFDFVASCIKKDAVRLRVFSKEFTGRFSISKSIPLNTLKQKLLEDGFTFAPKSKKSGPLCLNTDFSEPFSVKRFRFFLPVWEVLQKFKYFFFIKIRNRYKEIHS